MALNEVEKILILLERKLKYKAETTNETKMQEDKGRKK